MLGHPTDPTESPTPVHDVRASSPPAADRVRLRDLGRWPEPLRAPTHRLILDPVDVLLLALILLPVTAAVVAAVWL